MVSVCQAILVFYNNFESKFNGHLQYNKFWPEITGFFLCHIGKFTNAFVKIISAVFLPAQVLMPPSKNIIDTWQYT